MIFVTGATGTVGSEVVRQLRAAGVPVRAGVRSPQKAADLQQLGAEVVEFDYARPETFAAALRGITRVFFLTVSAGFDAETEARFVQAMKDAGVQHVVKLSVWNAQDEAYLIARWHRESEKLIEQSGIPYTFLRPSGFMQNLPTFFGGAIKQYGAFSLPMTQAGVGHIDVRDIAAVAAKILRDGGHEGKGYNLSGPAAPSYSQVAALLAEVVGKPVHYQAVSPEDWKRTMLGYGQHEAMVDAMLDLYAYYERGGSAGVSSAVEEVTGRPPTSLAQFLREHAAAFGGGAKAAGPVPGSFVWHELKSPAPSASADFYGALFGWRCQSLGEGPAGPLWLFQKDADRLGTMVKLAPEQPAYWIPFFAVPDTDQQVARAVALGAKVVVPPIDVPAGRAAVLLDPQGAAIALFQSRP